MKSYSLKNNNVLVYLLTFKNSGKIFTWFLLSLLVQPLYAQDYVKTTNGTILNVHIVEVNLSVLKYTNKNDTVIRSIPRSDVRSFKYQTVPGDTVVTETDYIREKVDSKSVMYQKGMHDAEIHYVKYRAAANGTFWTTVLVGPGPGMIPAFITSSIGPKEKNLGYTDTLMMKDPEYYKGYTIHAKAKKGKKVWHGYLGGVVFNVGFLFLILLAGS